MRADSESEVYSSSQDPEYTPPLTRNRSQGRNRGVAVSHRWMRLLYFSIASTWGFLCGAIGLAMVSSARDRALEFEDPAVLLLLVPALAAAILGGAISAAAYRDARRKVGK